MLGLEKPSLRSGNECWECQVWRSVDALLRNLAAEGTLVLRKGRIRFLVIAPGRLTMSGTTVSIILTICTCCYSRIVLTHRRRRSATVDFVHIATSCLSTDSIYIIRSCFEYFGNHLQGFDIDNTSLLLRQ